MSSSPDAFSVSLVRECPRDSILETCARNDSSASDGARLLSTFESVFVFCIHNCAPSDNEGCDSLCSAVLKKEFFFSSSFMVWCSGEVEHPANIDADTCKVLWSFFWFFFFMGSLLSDGMMVHVLRFWIFFFLLKNCIINSRFDLIEILLLWLDFFSRDLIDLKVYHSKQTVCEEKL